MRTRQMSVRRQGSLRRDANSASSRDRCALWVIRIGTTVPRPVQVPVNPERKSAGEVVGVDVVEELPELIDNRLAVLLLLDHLPGLVEDRLFREDR